MPDLTIHHQNRDTDKVGFDRVYKIKKGQEQAAVAAAKKNGLDDVVFRMSNGDVFIASRRGVPGDVEPFDQVSFKDEVTYGGLRGEVITVDNQRNTVGESSKRGLLWGLGGWLGGTAGLFGLSLKVLGGRIGLPVILIGGAVAGAASLIAGIATGRGKVDYEMLHQYSDKVDGVSK
jgi:hypothetical protein